MAPWKLPLIVAGVVVPVAAAFLLGGPGVGVAIGALAAVVLVAVAVRQRPEGSISPAADRSGGRHVLIVAAEDVEDPADVERITRAAGIEGEAGPGDEVRVLVPARIGFLDRWASDVEGARQRAQQRLVVTVAALAAAGVAAEARVGDEDIVQAVEDQLQSYPATEVVLVGADADGEGEAAEQLRSRLRAGFHYVRLG
ncbi:MAG TPA: hypothetical protein VG898_00975 [Solirubrobacterales bacterium]|nr:hypothetical protein [Solirubrobacterales bacterium]